MESLGLSPWLVSSCAEMGLREPTPIQAACVKPALDGRDIVGSAETGSGKTAAFALPILQALSADPHGIFALVLSPARELAHQIADQFAALGAPLRVRVCVVVGGADMMPQALELSQRPHIVVATPGRFADHLRSSNVAPAVAKLRFVVIDEERRADEAGAVKKLCHTPALGVHRRTGCSSSASQTTSSTSSPRSLAAARPSSSRLPCPAHSPPSASLLCAPPLSPTWRRRMRWRGG